MNYFETQERTKAFELLNQYMKSESLIRHSLAVEAAMLWYANYYSENPINWGISGLLHDFDYEMYPDNHPYEGNKILTQLNYNPEILESIMAHADYTNVSRTSLMSKALYAVDELSGLIVAASYMRPDKSVVSLELSSIKKRFKDKAFARGCNRDDIINGAKDLGIELDQHMDNVLKALQESAERLGIAGVIQPSL